jgi:hypothetical protein
MDEYWAKLRANQLANGTLSPDDVDHLPASLKKNTQITILGQGEDQKAVETSIQCDGCNRWGTVADDYSDHADGIVEHPSVDQYLCYQCSSFWGSQTGLPATTQRVASEDVPDLSLNMEY